MSIAWDQAIVIIFANGPVWDIRDKEKPLTVFLPLLSTKWASAAFPKSELTFWKESHSVLFIPKRTVQPMIVIHHPSSELSLIMACMFQFFGTIRSAVMLNRITDRQKPILTICKYLIAKSTTLQMVYEVRQRSPSINDHVGLMSEQSVVCPVSQWTHKVVIMTVLAHLWSVEKRQIMPRRSQTWMELKKSGP